MCQIQDLTKRPSDNSGEGKNTDKERKGKLKTHRRKPTNRHGGGSMFMTPSSHLDHFYTHTHTVRRNVCSCCGPHTAEQICLNARSCVYHSLHPAHRNICEQAALFCVCVCVYCMHMCTCMRTYSPIVPIVCMCVSGITTDQHL